MAKERCVNPWRLSSLNMNSRTSAVPETLSPFAYLNDLTTGGPVHCIELLIIISSKIEEMRQLAP